jgi:hypothetical protein
VDQEEVVACVIILQPNYIQKVVSKLSATLDVRAEKIYSNIARFPFEVTQSIIDEYPVGKSLHTAFAAIFKDKNKN